MECKKRDGRCWNDMGHEGERTGVMRGKGRVNTGKGE